MPERYLEAETANKGANRLCGGMCKMRIFLSGVLEGRFIFIDVFFLFSQIVLNQYSPFALL